ncbi:hypothetical protein M3147_04590 [Agromyces mediolanus]|uniref:DUF6541 family protein n=1 Tax=Agromyces mediolanus TaxID=41986 RepID=UPI00203E883B|nr:DUF6541 family protein [Agromyces mediolanus]MCM3656524.1 hypothetical protein [Agromyces mediolanus]
MSWWQMLPVVLLAAAVLLVPGGLVLAAAGVRRLNLLALAMPVTFTVGGVVAVLAPFLRLPFSAPTFVGGAIIAAAVALLARLLLVRAAGRMEPHRSGWWPWAVRDVTRGGLAAEGRLPRSGFGRWRGALPVLGWTIGAALIARRLVLGFGQPENFSQTFDNIFHLNAVHHIAVTQSGSSLTLGNLTEASRAFYPAAMHDVVAIVEQLAGVDAAVAMNASVLVIAAVAWPLACMFLVARVVGYRPLPLLVAGALSAGLSGSPYLLIGFGVLYPLMAAMVIAPVALGLVIELLRLSAQRSRSWIAPILAFIAILPGFMLTHPSAVIAVMALTIPLLLARLLLAWRSSPGPQRRAVRTFWTIAVPVYLIVFLIVWLKVRPNLGAAPWGATQTTSGAIGEVAAASPIGAITAWVYLFGTILGLYAIVRWLPSRWWLIACYAIAGTLYVFAAGWGSGALRTFMVGVWYNDPFRLAALLPVTTLPVVVIGVLFALDFLRRRVTGWIRRRRAIAGNAGWMGATVVLVCVALMVVATQGGALAGIQKRIANSFALDADSRLVTPDELALIREVADYVPEDGMIVGNPLTGAAYVYALGDRSTVAPHVFGERSADELILLRHWDEAAFRGDVCPIIEEYNAYWALDFGTELVIPADEDEFRGVDSLSSGLAPDVEVLAQVGDARLVRTTACD